MFDASGRPIHSTPRIAAFVLASALLTCLLPSIAVAAEPRIALLITNQSYKQPGAALTNTHRDGEILKASLERVGFKVWTVRDTTNEGAMLRAIGDHVQRMSDAGPEAVGFFYYSGHGAADRPNGENFLIPTDMPINRASELPLMAVRLERITSTLSNTGKMSFVIFDACRNVPLQRSEKSPFKGFAPVREQNGLLLAFATEPGNVAIDQNLYAKALAEELIKPDVEAAEVFRRVRQRVRADTRQGQSPEYVDRRDYGFHFVLKTALAAVPPLPQTSEAERTWPWIEDTTNQAVLENFIKQFSDSAVAANARNRLEELKKQQAVVALATPPPSSPPATAKPDPPVQAKAPADVLPAAPLAPKDAMTLGRELQKELLRVGCDPGAVNGTWGEKTKEALAKFSQTTKIALNTHEPTEDALRAVAGKAGRVCPLVCAANQIAAGGRCIAKAPLNAGADKEQPKQVVKDKGPGPQELCHVTAGNSTIPYVQCSDSRSNGRRFP